MHLRNAFIDYVIDGRPHTGKFPEASTCSDETIHCNTKEPTEKKKDKSPADPKKGSAADSTGKKGSAVDSAGKHQKTPKAPMPLPPKK